MSASFRAGFQDAYLLKTAAEGDPYLSPEQVMYNTYSNWGDSPRRPAVLRRSVNPPKREKSGKHLLTVLTPRYLHKMRHKKYPELEEAAISAREELINQWGVPPEEIDRYLNSPDPAVDPEAQYSDQFALLDKIKEGIKSRGMNPDDRGGEKYLNAQDMPRWSPGEALTPNDIAAIRNTFPFTEVTEGNRPGYRDREREGYADSLEVPYVGRRGGKPVAYHEIAHRILRNKDRIGYGSDSLSPQEEMGAPEWPAVLTEQAAMQQSGHAPPPTTHSERMIQQGLQNYGPRLTGETGQDIQALKRWLPALEGMKGSALPSTWRKGGGGLSYSPTPPESDTARAAKLSAGHESFKRQLPAMASKPLDVKE